MIKIIRRLFCVHSYRFTHWHWTHGPTGHDPASIEAEIRCEKCGKTRYIYPPRGSDEEKYLSTHRQDLRR